METDKELQEKLKAEYAIARATLDRVSAEMDVVDNRLKIPELKDKYEGKFFLFESFKGDQTWYFCREVLPNGYGLMDSFEIAGDKYEFKSFEEAWMFYESVTEITRDEYISALRLFTSKLMEFGDRTIKFS